MELNIIEDKKTKMVFEIKGEDHTLPNALTKELWNVNGVKVAAYGIDHPLMGSPKLVIETDSSIEPRKALKTAVSSLQKKNQDLLEKFKKAAK
jgi:DNA-directed RNA polymerase subunit L